MRSTSTRRTAKPWSAQIFVTSGVVGAGPQQRSTGIVAILDTGRGDVDGQQQAQSIGDDEPLRPLTFLPASKVLVVAGDGVGGSDGLQIDQLRTSALHFGRRLRGPWPRKASWIRPTVPASCHPKLKYQYTVGQGAKAFGSCRQPHPVRKTWKITPRSAREDASPYVRPLARPALAAVWLYQRPLPIRQVRRIPIPRITLTNGPTTAS